MTSQIKVAKRKKRLCPRCGSARVQIRKTDRMCWCRECLAEWAFR